MRKRRGERKDSKELLPILLKYFIYDPSTGIFSRRIAESGFTMETPVGCISNTGYLMIRVKGAKYSAHKLAWLYMYGNLPTKQLDHINGIRNDNRIENLREVSNRQNAQNMKCHREGKILGVDKTRSGRYTADIFYNGVMYSLGVFDEETDAKLAYKIASENAEKGIAPVPIKSLRGDSLGIDLSGNRWRSWVSVEGRRLEVGHHKERQEAVQYRKLAEKLKEENPKITREAFKELFKKELIKSGK